MVNHSLINFSKPRKLAIKQKIETFDFRALSKKIATAASYDLVDRF